MESDSHFILSFLDMAEKGLESYEAEEQPAFKDTILLVQVKCNESLNCSRNR